jgi:hypothetical protein
MIQIDQNAGLETVRDWKKFVHLNFYDKYNNFIDFNDIKKKERHDFHVGIKNQGLGIKI